MLLLIIQRILLDFLLDIVYFPLWWYTKGAKQVLLGCVHWIQQTNTTMAPGLWLKNLFVPMYGQTDWQGRLMSVFMRFVNVIGRSIALSVYSIVITALFVLWLAFPLLLGGMILSSLIGSITT